MRYLDSGRRTPDQALGFWLRSEAAGSAAEFRAQSGFFSADGLKPIAQDLRRLAASSQAVRMLIGSNDATTLAADVRKLVDVVGVPRVNGDVGVLSFKGAFFHPKTFHFKRRDGSQVAYVGSGNLTGAGVASLHVEAGIILDTAEGDSDVLLGAIADGVNAWFDGAREGIERVNSLEDIDHLEARGLLASVPLPRTRSGASGGSGKGSRPVLKPLIDLGHFDVDADLGEEEATNSVAPISPALQLPSAVAVPRPPYPPYVLFDPSATEPTVGGGALSGASLPAGAAGILFRLNRDSARHFEGRAGTANVSIPVPLVSTLRFGIYQSRYDRPRAEFELRSRYWSDSMTAEVRPSMTNVMPYGFAEGEAGHGDVRMLVPVGPSRDIATVAGQHGLPVPADRNVALLEWPTPPDPSMRLTFLDPRSGLYKTAEAQLQAAEAAGYLVGQSASWLAPGVSPPW